MSGLIGPGGEPIDLSNIGGDDEDLYVYKAEGIVIETTATVENQLQAAMEKCQKTVGRHVYEGALQAGASDMEARAAATTAAAEVPTPFVMEPAAQAVFMLLANEIAWRDELITNLATRLEALDGQKAPERPGPAPDDDAN